MKRQQTAAATVVVLTLLLSVLLTGSAGANPSGPEGDGRGASASEKLDRAPRSSTRAMQDVTPPTITAECPPTIRCVVAPAAYQANDGNEADYGNYDTANRPSDGLKINSIIIHDGEGSCEAIINAFKNPRHYASSQYVVCRDGTVYQMVRNQDLPWHAGNWWFNMHSIGIEHEGSAATGSTDYTNAMYWASAQLVKYLTTRFNIPRDRGHILGHDNVSAVKDSQVAGMHYDPGPFWNWQNYMALVGAPVLPSGGFNSEFVTVAPTWPLSKQTVTGCEGGTCPSQPTNFVYVRTEPRADAPFITDPIVGQGSTVISNNAARLFHGQTFGNPEKKIVSGGIWYKVWANGISGWFFSPHSAPTALPASAKYITPKAGKSSIPVYGRPSPKAGEYPQKVTDPATGEVKPLLEIPPASFWIPTLAPEAPLSYRISAGQRYAVIDANAPNDHFYAWTITADRTLFPEDHTRFVGTERYVEIQLGNRVGFVKFADVDIK
jgi:hypothetical protein